MRIGILTASRTNNNGTDLQCAAMYRLFQQEGAQVEVIDYACAKLDNSRKLMHKFSVMGVVRLPWQIFNHLSHEAFRKKHFVKSPKTYYPQNLHLEEYDAVVVGSDQIWNLKITGNDCNFFLPESCGKTRRYSYAASLGETDITKWEEQFGLSRLLQNFDGVSVREDSGVKALAHIGVWSREDLDPILCMSNQDWEQLCPAKPKKEKYVLLYTAEHSGEMITAAKEYAQKTGAKVLRIGNLKKPIPGVRTLSFVGMEKWLGLMRNADMVFTNSYHGLSTAIAMHTNFRLFRLQKAEHNTRSEGLLEKLGLTEYIGYRDEEPPAWCVVEERLEVLRRRSAAYRKTILEEN